MTLQEKAMFEKIKSDFKGIAWLLIVVGVVVNGAGALAMSKTGLPLYLDSIGTVFVAVVAGPWAGALTGLLTNLILGVVSPGYAPYWSVPLLIGLVTGFLANAGWFKHWLKVFALGLIIAALSAVMSSLIAGIVFGNFTFNLAYFLVEEPVDKVATAFIVFIVLQFLPKQWIALFPRRENVD
jgi:energy-coupling factor transport system substrate-specific component